MHSPVSSFLPLSAFYEKPLEGDEKASLELLQKRSLKLEADQKICQLKHWICEDITFTPTDFARYFKTNGLEAWVVGPQTVPSDTPKWGINVCFYLDPSHGTLGKLELHLKLEYLISQFIRSRALQNNDQAATLPLVDSELLTAYGIYMHTYSSILADNSIQSHCTHIKLDALQVSAIYRMRIPIPSIAIMPQWNLLRGGARFAIGHAFAVDRHAFELAKKEFQSKNAQENDLNRQKYPLLEQALAAFKVPKRSMLLQNLLEMTEKFPEK